MRGVREVEVQTPKLHPTQEEFWSARKRFNHIRCGRRWGKTTLISRLIEEIVLPEEGDPLPVGVWYPTYKDMGEVWIEIKKRFAPVTIAKDEVKLKIYIAGGGRIDFWAMQEPESGQGFKYGRAIIDEAAKAKKLKQAWRNTIRPTLADYEGDAFIMSRPKGKANDFFALEQEMRGKRNWAFFKYRIHDNPVISAEEIKELEEDLGETAFNQECLAEYVDENESPFLFNFSEDSHTGHVEEDPLLQINLSFDFNLEPFAVIAYQKPDFRTIRIFWELKESSDIYQVCDKIIATFGEQSFRVTGDASGRARTGVVRGKRSYWDSVKGALKLKEPQIRVRSKNLDLVESRNLCNLAFKHCDILIDSNCENLINQCKFAQVDEYGVLKKDREFHKNDFLDDLRYCLDAEFPDIIRRTNKYKTLR